MGVWVARVWRSKRRHQAKTEVMKADANMSAEWELKAVSRGEVETRGAI